MKLKFTNLAVFLIFFGIALLKQSKTKLAGGSTLLALGVSSLWADLKKISVSN